MPTLRELQDARLKAEAAGNSTTPLPRSAFIDPTTGAERPLNNPVTNPVNYQNDVNVGESNAVINRQIDAIAHSTLAPEVKQQQMQALTAQKAAPVGITPQMRTQIVNEQNLPQNLYTPPTVERDTAKEASILNKYGLNKDNPADVDSGLSIVYKPPQLTALINSGQVDASVFGADKLKELGITPQRIQQLMDQTSDPNAKARLQSAYQNLIQTGQMGSQVESTLNATPKPTNQMMGILSEALNAKSNFKNQQLGTSDLFKAAGLSGYAVLAQSLGQRAQEMQDKSKSAQNLIAEAGGAMATTYKAIADNYNKIIGEYNDQMKMLLDIDKQARDHEQAIDLMKQQDELNRKTFAFEQSVKDQYATDKTTPKYDDNGNYLGYYDNETKSFVKADTANVAAKGSGGWLGALTDIFYQPGKGDYGNGEGKRQCGEGYNDITTGVKVGDSYASKMKAVVKQDNPQVGNGLVLPLKINGTLDNGHIETVVKVDLANDSIDTVSWNRDGKGTQTTQTYKISDLKKKYGNNWGFTDSQLKSSYSQKLDAVSGDNAIIAGAKTGAMVAGSIGAAVGAAAGAIGSILPKTSPQQRLYDAVYSSSDKLEASDPKSTMRKRFDAMTPTQQDQYISDLLVEKQKKDNAYEGA